MAWSIGLLLGESIIEMTGCADPTKPESCVQSRALIPNGSPENALQAFLLQNSIDAVDSVNVLTASPFYWIENGLGSPTAVLTTAGFENWLELNLPLKTKHLTSQPNRMSLLLDRELLFGVSERVNSEGHIEKILDEKELEFLSAKLELHEIKNVAICFLNSTRNSENEKRAKDYLTAKGLQVHTSSQYTAPDEKARFWSALLNCYISPLFQERLKKIQTGLQKATNEQTLWSVGEHTFTEFFDSKCPPLAGALSLSEHIGKSFATTQSVLYCGLEDFWLFKPGKNGVNYTDILPFKTIGNLAASHVEFEVLRPQPLTKLGRSFFSEVALTDEDGTFDPGPMLLGRGLTPTFFDLLGLSQKEIVLSGLSEKLTDKSRQRLNESLLAYAKNIFQYKSDSVESLMQKIFKIASARWQPALDDVTELNLIGPLATWVKSTIPFEANTQVIGDDFFVARSILSSKWNGGSR